MKRKKTWQMKHVTDSLICIIAIISSPSYTATTYDIIEAILPGVPFKVMEKAVERSFNRGLISCGVSTNYIWLTPKGREFINTTLYR